MLIKSNIKISSNRNFGLVFFIVFLILGFWPIINAGEIKIWLVVISLIFLVLGMMKSKLLTPLNKLWFKFGIFLGAIISPIVMGLVYFLVVAPIGIFMRLLGKDLLKTRKVKNTSTYWIKRDKQISRMKKQF